MTTDTSDQAAPALSLEDQEAIRALVNEYAYLLDHGRWADVRGRCSPRIRCCACAVTSSAAPTGLQA